MLKLFLVLKQFSEARKVCEGSNGHLLMMRSVVEENVISLMQNQSASLWIELQLPQDCTKASQEPSGSRWVTDDESPDYVIWKLDIPICKNQCVTVSQDLSWEERQCDFMADGFLCEYNYPGTCTRLSAGASTAMTYTTPFKAQDSDLLALPPQTTASIPALGLELICTEHSRGVMRWSSGLPGTWHCEVENGGCEGVCHEKDGCLSCTCPDGWKLEADKRSCSTSCAGAPCKHLCNPHGADFTCMCHKGYKLTEDGISCQDIDDCQVNPHICDQVCINTEGGFQCQCHQGYELVEGKCKDVIYCHETRCQQKCFMFFKYRQKVSWIKDYPALQA
ncbi:thrombomodulin isoform X1 [Alligator sinensis]|uniref:Thrombomodulin isoform X1 n=1 Tax=Alligator sinensis TaxID=38654 RepID=A0A3Q0GEN1_ALLSI|nr:thrombomodulin isoform X1 [Alligator sinensis]